LRELLAEKGILPRKTIRESFSLVSLKLCSLFVLDYSSRTSLPLKDR